MTDKELMDKLRRDSTFNPWLDVADDWIAGGYNDQLIHPGDGECITDYNEKLGRFDVDASVDRELVEAKQLKLDILPQPFVGRPLAPIWILLRNPGYSAVDVYDLKSIKEGREEIKKEGYSKVRDLRISRDDEENLLKKRQKLVCQQLRFDLNEGNEFYLLRDEFHTLKEDKSRRKILGGYNWYTKYLFPSQGYFSATDKTHLEVASKYVFVLEYDPYHSRSYFESGVDFKHHTLWKRLVNYAIESKIIVARGGDILDRIKESVPTEKVLKAYKERRLFLFKSQNASFSHKNMYWPCSDCDLNPIVKELNQ